MARVSSRELPFRLSLLALTVGVLGLGALHTEVLVGLAFGFAALMLLGAPKLAPLRQPLMWPAAALAFAVLWTGLSLLPLPSSLLQRLANANYSVWQDAESVLAATRAAGSSEVISLRYTLSLAPNQTWVELAKLLTYLAAYLTFSSFAARRQRRTWIKFTVVAIGAVLAITVLLHPATHSTRVFGVYAPQTPLPTSRLAPLLNVNHLSGFLNLAIFVGLGFVLAPRSHGFGKTEQALPNGVRVVLGAAIALLALTVIWLGSRGGVASLVLGGSCVAALLLWSKIARRSSGRVANSHSLGPTLLVLAICIVGAAIILIASVDGTANELTSKDVSKLTIFRHATTTLRRYLWLGTGRGAFESVFPLDNPEQGHWVATHPENILLQWLIEWGAPVGVALLLVVAACLRHLLKALGRPLRTALIERPSLGGLLGIIVLVAQNLVDFSLEVPGVALCVLALLACCIHDSEGSSGTLEREAATGQRKRRLAIPTVALSSFLIATCIFIFPARERERFRWQRSLRDRTQAVMATQEAEARAIRTDIRAAVAEHPAEPYFGFLAGYFADRTGFESVVPWVGFTLKRSPIYGRAHLVLARSLRKRGLLAQSRLAYRMAIEQDSGLFSAFASETPILVNNYDDARALLPKADPERGWVYDHFASVLMNTLPATHAMLLDDRLSELGPKRPVQLLERVAMRELTNIQAGLCEPREQCIARATTLVAEVAKASPGETRAVLLTAELDVALGKPSALATFELACNTVSDRSHCLEELLRACSSHGDRPRVQTTLVKLLELPCQGTSCGDRYMLAAGYQPNERVALAYLRKAAALDPRRETWLALANHADRIEAWADAVDAYEHLALSDARYETKASEVRARFQKLPPKIVQPKRFGTPSTSSSTE
jgi:tetratricopeptide (TPR) repeat protein